MILASILSLVAAASQASATIFTCTMAVDAEARGTQTQAAPPLKLPSEWKVSFVVPVVAANAEDLPHGVQAHVQDSFLGIQSADGLIGGPPAFSFAIDEHKATSFKGARYSLTPWERPRNDMLLVEYKAWTVGKADARVGYGRGPCRATQVVENRQ